MAQKYSGSLMRKGQGGYGAFLTDLKSRIRTAQIRAALSVNRELIQLYWEIGGAIVRKQTEQGWGGKVIERLSQDIAKAFPEITGFSTTNISRMRAFYLAWANLAEISAQPVPKLRKRNSAQPVPKLDNSSPPPIVSDIPWGHNVVLLFRIDNQTERMWYAARAIEHGWSRNMLEHWIDSKLYGRQGKAITNFKTALPPAQSELAQQILKDPYNFDFLTIARDAMEKELEGGLLEQITHFLLELGDGFAFVGRQVRIEVDGEDFSIDLLFYHLHLRTFVVVDLKTGKFLPEFAGKMNFYLSAVDDLMRKATDGPSIGLILCKTRSKIVAEYALRHLQRPVGVAGYLTKLTAKLPKELAKNLPSVKQLEQELSRPHKPSRSKL